MGMEEGEATTGCPEASIVAATGIMATVSGVTITTGAAGGTMHQTLMYISHDRVHVQ